MIGGDRLDVADDPGDVAHAVIVPALCPVGTDHGVEPLRRDRRRCPGRAATRHGLELHATHVLPSPRRMAILIEAIRHAGVPRQAVVHLVSDASLDELHEFAAAHDIPRRGFQGDHYDVPEELDLC